MKRNTVRFEAAGAMSRPAELSLRFVDGSLVGDSTCGVTPRGLSVGALTPGSYSMTLELFDSDTEWVVTPMSGGGTRSEAKPYSSATKDVVLVAGRTLEVEL